MYPTFKTDVALHDFPTDTKFYFLCNIQLVNIQNLYKVTLNTANYHYTLPHYSKGVTVFPKVVRLGFTYSVGTEDVLW